jgi:alpha-beta hydrolase superfamily lysophospholipase
MAPLNPFQGLQSIGLFENLKFMFQRSESFFTGVHNTRLFYQVWEPEKVRGHLVITHGQAEHSGCYQRLIDGLKDLSFAVYAWDLRGHGRSEGKRGYAKDFEDYIKDLQLFIQHLRDERGLYPKDLALLAHSMGGLIQMKMLLNNSHWEFPLQVLSAPMFGVAVDVPLYKDLAALVLKSLLPTLTLGNEIQFEALSRDPEVISEYRSDVLRHDRISAGVYLGSITTIETLRSNMHKIETPTLFQIPENDPVVGSKTTQELFKKLGASQKVLKIYPDRKHEIYNDLGRDEAFQDASSFIAKNFAGK